MNPMNDKKKEKVIKKRKTLNKKKKKLHDVIVFMQFFLHICGEMGRDDIQVFLKKPE